MDMLCGGIGIILLVVGVVVGIGYWVYFAVVLTKAAHEEITSPQGLSAGGAAILTFLGTCLFFALLRGCQ